VIIISHRFSTVRNADKIYVLDNGQIIESGKHTELMKLKGRYYNAFNIQAKGYK
jgi:ATP-binding cassette subfamily B protein